MSYNPKEYWSKRINPNKYYDLKWWDLEVLQPLVKKHDTILDYGPGDGRNFPIYEGKTVYVKDIVDRHKETLMIMAYRHDIEFSFYLNDDPPKAELGVLNKVLLHSQEPEEIINYMKSKCDTLFICTGVGSKSSHCFDHDYKSLFTDVKHWEQRGKDLVIVI